MSRSDNATSEQRHLRLAARRRWRPTLSWRCIDEFVFDQDSKQHMRSGEQSDDSDGSQQQISPTHKVPHYAALRPSASTTASLVRTSLPEWAATLTCDCCQRQTR